MAEDKHDIPEDLERTVRMERPDDCERTVRMARPDDCERTVRMERPDDCERTVRMERPENTETTRTRKIVPPPPAGDDTEERPFEKEEKSSVGVFFEHITGIFHRKTGAEEIDAAPQPETPEDVSLDRSDAERFPPLEAAFTRGEEIGAGGQARLYRGFDLHLRRQAAVKSLREEQGRHPELRDKFVSEAMITAQLDHPAIVPVYSIHRDKDGNLHLAMKLVRGRPFQTYLAELVRHYDRDGFSAAEEKRSLDYRLEVFLTICDALEYAHNRNIMHCDLKPENIMIGEYHEAYLMDWGLAQPIDDPEFDPEKWKAPTVITGTPRFLSPEAVRGEHCDQRADIYAMGLILYEIVTLQYGYPGSDHQKTIASIRRGEMRPVAHRYKYPIPTDLRKIILKAAAWDKTKRYRTMGELSADLRHFIRGEEVSANPDNLFGRLARWGYRRRRLMLILMLCTITLGAVGVAYSLYEKSQHERQRRRDEAARHRQQQALAKQEQALAEQRYAQEQAQRREEAALHHRQQALTVALGYALGASRSLDRQIFKMENGLRSVTAEALLLLNADDLTVNSKPPIYSLTDLHDPQKRPATLVDSPGFGFTVDIDHIAYHISRGCHPEKLEDRMRRLTLLQPMLMRTIVESSHDSVLSEENLPALRERALKNGIPLVSLYFGFDDGVFVTYPGELGIDHNGTYDHRKRWWYKLRTESDKSSMLKWHTPYLSVNGKLVFSCTLPMIDTKGRHHGVAAADISLPKMLDELREEGNHGKALLEKSIVNDDGNVVLDLGKDFMRDTAKYYAVENGDLKRIPYPDQELFKEIRKRRVGYIVREEGGKRVAYVFAGLFSVPWYYIEKLDLDELLKTDAAIKPKP